MTFMIFGHLAIVGIAKLTGFRQENLVIMTLASYGPDILDKPLNIFWGMPGRGVSHSLVAFAFIAMFACIYWLKINRNPRILTATATLWTSHLIGDLVEREVLFWPFAGPLRSTSRFHVTDRLFAYYVDLQRPYQLGLEIVSMMAIIGVIIFCICVWNATPGLSLAPARRASDRFLPLNKH